MAALATACLLSAGMATVATAQRPVQKLLDAHYELAIKLIAKGDHKGGIGELRLALKTDPKDIAARVLLGNTLLEIEDGATAATEFLQARKDGALDSFVSAPLARAYVMQGRYQDALTELEKAADNESTEAKVSVIRGDAYLGLQKYRTAEKYFRKALKIRPEYSTALNGMARSNIARRDFAGAGRYVDKALAAVSSDYRAWYLKGEIARLQNNEDEALAHYSRSAELAPRFVLPLLARAWIVIGRGDYDAARPDLEAVFRQDGKNPHATLLQSLVLAHRGDLKQAREKLVMAEAFLRDLPAGTTRSDPPSQYLRGVFAYFSKDYAQAYRHLTAYLKHDPRDRGAQKLLGSLALATGDSRYALQLLEKLSPGAPDDIEVQILYGDALMRARRHMEAAAVLEKAASIEDPDHPALSRLVMLRGVALQNDKARDFLKAAILRNPQAVKAALMMVTALLTEREYSQGLAIAKTVADHQSGNAVAHNLAGAAYLGLNDMDAARDSFRAAFDADPSYVLAMSNLARLEMSQGNQRAAWTLYSRIVEKDKSNGTAMMALAELELRRKKLDRALRWLENARDTSRKPDAAALRLVDLYLVASRPDKALAVARELHGRDPASLTYLSALGRTLVASDRSDTAALAFREVANRAARMKSSDWLVGSAAWLLRARDEKGARDTLHQALKLDGRDLTAHLALFRLDLASGKTAEALDRATRIAAFDKRSSVGNTLQGDAYMRMKKFSAALKAYETALTRNQTNVQAERVYRARHAAGRGALEFARIWSEQRPRDTGARLLLAAAYDDAGQPEQAVSVYKSLLDAAPTETRLLTSLALHYQGKGDPRALELAERAYKISHTDAAVLDTYGWVMIQQGDRTEGLMLLRNAAVQDPDDPVIRYHLAVALNQFGDRDAARRQLQAALKSGRHFDGAAAARQLLSKLAPANR